MYKTGTQAINSKPRGPKENDEGSVHLFVFHPNLFQVHSYASLMRQIPNKGGNSGKNKIFGEVLDGVLLSFMQSVPGWG